MTVSEEKTKVGISSYETPCAFMCSMSKKGVT